MEEGLKWLTWGVLLILQNASFTLVSRARNSGSLLYHALAAVGSNGIWFASQLILVDSMLRIIHEANWSLGLLTAIFYTFCTIVGSVGMHWIALTKLERGARRVGATA